MIDIYETYSLENLYGTDFFLNQIIYMAWTAFNLQIRSIQDLYICLCEMYTKQNNNTKPRRVLFREKEEERWAMVIIPI